MMSRSFQVGLILGCWASMSAAALAGDMRCELLEATYAPAGGNYQNASPQVEKLRLFNFDLAATEGTLATSLDWAGGATTRGFLSLVKPEDYERIGVARELVANESNHVLLSRSSDASVEVSLTAAPERSLFGHLQYTAVLFRTWRVPGSASLEREVSVGDCVYR